MHAIGRVANSWLGLALAGVVAGGTLARLDAAPAAPARTLERGFVQPPDSARPWVYWFWLNGNITREGITADLEAMKRAGIGGALIMEVDQGAPLGPVGFMSKEWRELFKHVAAEAQRLGLEVNLNNDAGWNGSGGPWIKPEESMQKVVWTETNVAGPSRFEGALPQPPATAGYYRDIAALAFPTPGPYRIDNLKVKASYEVGFAGAAASTNLPPEMVIELSRIAVLTEQTDKYGQLAWDVPPGRWTLLRLGHTSTGVQNAPSPASGRGLECDKLSKEGIAANFAGMIGKLIADVGPAAGKSLVATHIDSWENGAQNWTARMREEFKQRRGYEMLPFLPVLTGRVVGSLEVSERFLWDLRQTVSDLVVENYAGHLGTLARARGLKLSIEAYGGPCDDLTYAGRADEPMCEFWIGGGGFPTPKEMASAAHIYGKPVLGAEAFTADDRERWREHPASIKALGDRAFCDGVNRFVFHRYALQPWPDRRPGMTMGPWGLHYERTQTWWEFSPAWHQYLARCQYLLRQGRFVADLCFLQPEASPQGFHGHPRQPYDYDNCNAEVVLTRLAVKDGRLVLPDGMSYRLLALPEVNTMTLPLLRKLKDLVQAGATIVGPRPLKTPGLSDYPKCDAELKRLADELWGDCDGKSVKQHRFGQGRVVWGVTPDKVLAETGVAPDFTSQSRLRYIHRAADDVDIYFVANPLPHPLEAVAAFRVSGKRPELWWPDTGRIERAAVFKEADGATRVWLPLGPSGSVFVVFRPQAGPAVAVAALTRDGKPLLPELAPAPKVVVRSATYGVPGDARRSRDARAKVQQLVDGGELSFHVARLAQGDDPAQGVVKTLVVEYTAGGQPITVKGQDPDVVHLAGQAPNVVVHKAVYGVLDDPKRTRDVRARVQRLVDTGEASFEVARLAEGDDPAFLVVKTVVIEYSAAGQRLTATGADPDTIYLAPPPTVSERGAEARADAAGRLVVEAWQPGCYELTTAAGKTRRFEVPALPPPLEIRGPWEVSFAPGWGAPPRVTFDRLLSWPEHPDPGVKFFSGTASYAKKFELPRQMLGRQRRLYLDLGKVQVMAQVKLNGRELGVLWKPPYRVDVTGAARAGNNALQVNVVNLWPNRMIGDEQLAEDSERNPDGTLKQWPAWLQDGQPSLTGRFTFTSWRLWKKDSPLLESGLLGPVTLRAVETESLSLSD